MEPNLVESNLSRILEHISHTDNPFGIFPVKFYDSDSGDIRNLHLQEVSQFLQKRNLKYYEHYAKFISDKGFKKLNFLFIPDIKF
jgi:hypothetical protein